MKSFVFAFCLMMPLAGFTQFVASFHQSNLPFAGFGYQVSNRVRPELRLGIEDYADVVSAEAVVLYDLIKQEEYEFYAGAGLITRNTFFAFAMPIGLNIYPLPVKQFGFHIELTPLIEEGILLRGSWGIRYRFGKNYSRQKK